MRRRYRSSSLLLGLCLAVWTVLPLATSASEIGFTVEDLPDGGGPDVWRYTYHLPADLALAPGQGLAVHFAPDLYGAISGAVAPSGGDWSALAIQPDPLLPDEGAYDLQAQTAAPDTSGTFQVMFVWNGLGDPGVQPFAIYGDDFHPIETGETYSLPEPAAGLVVGIVALACLGRRRRRGHGRLGVAGAAVCAVVVTGAFVSAETAAAQSVIHSFEAGGYQIEYWQVDRARVERTVTDFDFEARIVNQTAGSAPQVVARAQSASASSTIVQDLVTFGDVGPFEALDSQGAFTLRQDRAVLFDPADISFLVEEDSTHPCAPLSLSLRNPLLFEEVALLGLSVVDATTLLSARGPETTIALPIAQAEDGSYFFTAFPHPDLAGNAGSYRVTLESTGETCDLGTVDVPALPLVDPNEADAILVLLEQLATQLLASYGFDPLAFDPTAPDPTAAELTLALLWRALLFDESPTQISAIRADVAALSEPDRALLGGILTEAGVRVALEEMLLVYGDLSLPPPSSMGATAQVSSPLMKSAPVATAASIGACVPTSLEPVSILSAGELSAAMIASANAASSLEREATRRKVGSTVLGAAGFAGPLGQAVAVSGGAILLGQEAGDENGAKLLPSQITEMVLEAPVNPINEDYMDVPNQVRPRWFAYTSAQSQGMNLGKRVLDIALKSAGAVPSAAPLGASLSVFDGASTWAFQSQDSNETCFSIPAQSWTRIPVTDVQWLSGAPTVSGISLQLIDTFKMDPVGIGITNIDVRLDPSLFPCDSCTLGQTSDDIDVEVRQKSVAFTQAQYPIDGPIGSVLMTGTIRNSSRPDLWAVFTEPGVEITSVDPPDPSFSLTVKGLGDSSQFPSTVTVRSNSTTLPAGTPLREGSATIVLDPMVQVFQSADQCVGPDVPVTLDAVVTGLGVTDVSWTQPPGSMVDPVTGSQAIFTASSPGTYTVTAASVEDPSVFGSIDVVVTDCEIEMYFSSTVIGLTPSSSETDPPCGAGSSPGGQEVQEEIGVEPDFLTTGTFRNPVDWSSGGSFPFNINLTDYVTSTYYFDQQCYFASIPTEGSAVGSFSTIGGSNTLDIDFDVALQGGCRDVTGDFRDCLSGGSVVNGVTTFVFEHLGEGTQSYEYTANLTCDLTPSAAPNVLMTIAVMDSSGVIDSGYLIQVLPINQILEELSRASTAACYQGQPVAIQETFDFLDFPASGTYTVAIVVTVTGAPVITTPQSPPDEYMDQGGMSGTISVRALPAP